MTSALTEIDIWTASVHAPAPHEDVDAATVIVGEQALANRTKYLRARGFVDMQIWSFTEEDGITIPDDLFGFNSTSYAVNTNDADAMSITFSDVLVGDLFLIRFDADTFTTSVAGKSCYARIHATDNLGTGSEAAIAYGGLRVFPHEATYPLAMSGHHVAAAAGQTRIRVLGKQGPAPASGLMGFAERIYFEIMRFRSK